jgi:hypothetical protein
MDKNTLEQLITALIDKTLEHLHIKDRVEHVNIFLGEPLGIEAIITDGTSSHGSTWTVTVEEEQS